MKRVAISLVVVMAVFLGGCYNAREYTGYAADFIDPDFAINRDWWAGITLEKGHPTACIEASSPSVPDGWQCRSMLGIESVGDHRNWILDDFSDGSILKRGGTDTSGNLGYTLMMEDGRVFEGCDWISPNNSYICDFQSRKWTSVWPKGNPSGWDKSLVVFWDWNKYNFNSGVCATGSMASLMLGSMWTLSSLFACVESFEYVMEGP